MFLASPRRGRDWPWVSVTGRYVTEYGLQLLSVCPPQQGSIVTPRVGNVSVRISRL